MITKEYLKSLAGKLLFDMEEEEYATLEKEFAIILKNMERIDNFPNLKDVEPLRFPYVLYHNQLREDEINEDIVLSVDEVLKNSKHNVNDQVKVPKVVE